jgi:hypothetical protein
LIPIEKITLTVGERTLPLTEAEDEPVVKWVFGDLGILAIDKSGNLQLGDQRLEIYQWVKAPFIPHGIAATGIRVLIIPA